MEVKLVESKNSFLFDIIVTLPAKSNICNIVLNSYIASVRIPSLPSSGNSLQL